MGNIKFNLFNLNVRCKILCFTFFVFPVAVCASSWGVFHAEPVSNGNEVTAEYYSTKEQVSKYPTKRNTSAQVLLAEASPIPELYEQGKQDSHSINKEISPEPASSKTKADKPETKAYSLNNIYLYKVIQDKQERIKIRNKLIEFGQNYLPEFIFPIYKKGLEGAFHYPITLVFLFMILVFITNLIFVLLVLNYSTQRKNKRERYVSIFRKMYEEVLLLFMFGEIDWDTLLVKLKRIEKPLNRKILVEILFNYQENLRGEMDKQIPEIFAKLNLFEDSVKAVEASQFHKKVQGIRELTHMYPEGALPIIEEYLNHSNDDVRAQAQTSYVLLNKENPFDFFRTLNSPFMRWTQLSVFYLFQLHKFPTLSFVHYLKSDHPNVRNFCLRMIIFFQQLENSSEIFEMLDHEMELTRFLSIKAINELRLYDGRVMIKERFAGETEKNKLEIIKALMNIGTEEDFEFLEAIIKSGTVSQKIEACRSMFYMSPEGSERLQNLDTAEYPELELYLAHVNDPRN